MSTVVLDDTTGCPSPACCEACGARRVALTVCTADTPMGVMCGPLCSACIDGGRLPYLSLPHAAARVLAHCEHLGIDLEQAAELRAAESFDSAGGGG